jgi:hypothetical protein
MGGKLIGLNGLKQSGKDTTGHILVEQHGFVRASYAALLYESVAALWGVPVEMLDKLKSDPRVTLTLSWPTGLADEEGVPYMQDKTFTLREHLQRYGTEAHRNIFGFDFWIEQCWQFLDPGTDYVFTDARFNNELAAIKAQGGSNIRVERPGLEADGDTHASEAPPDPALIDAVLTNDGTIEDLAGKVAGLFASGIL